MAPRSCGKRLDLSPWAPPQMPHSSASFFCRTAVTRVTEQVHGVRQTAYQRWRWAFVWLRQSGPRPVLVDRMERDCGKTQIVNPSMCGWTKHLRSAAMRPDAAEVEVKVVMERRLSLGLRPAVVAIACWPRAHVSAVRTSAATCGPPSRHFASLRLFDRHGAKRPIPRVRSMSALGMKRSRCAQSELLAFRPEANRGPVSGSKPVIARCRLARD